MADTFRRRKVEQFHLNSEAPEELGERAWFQEAGRSPSFAFLSDPSEDIYTLNDGRRINMHGRMIGEQ